MDDLELLVRMADLKIAKSPCILSSLGIGSCVGIVLYDKFSKIGGMAHIMLPDVNVVKHKSNRAKFANTAIPDMLGDMLTMGAKKQFITAKIFGGAHMFGKDRINAVFNVGTRNVLKVKEVLNDYKIRIIAEDTGGTFGRSLFFDTETGAVKIRTLSHGEKYL